VIAGVVGRFAREEPSNQAVLPPPGPGRILAVMRDRFLSIMLPAAVLFATAAGAMAQFGGAGAGSEEIPPEPSLRGSLPVWLGYLIIFALFGAVVVVSLMPSKRAHQSE